MEVNIIGAGLAGSEAALQLAGAGYNVRLWEMRPHKQTPAHTTGLCAELVCSNSLKSMLPDTGAGLLKAELEILGCCLLPIAKQCAVPAGGALAVDRLAFAQKVQDALESNPQITVERKEVTLSDFDSQVIIAAGPLASDALVKSILQLTGENNCYFFDAVAPIVATESIDYERAFFAARYDKGEGDYLNCPLEKDEYYEFVEALQLAKKHEAHEFENQFFQNIDFKFYENCMPIEELARRGKETLRFGVMRPVGIINPKTGKRPYAVIQLRTENKNKNAYNLVGCQTMLVYGEQKRVFSKIPALKNAEFLRLGSIHRNTYFNAPLILSPDLSLKKNPDIFLAGQISGLEGYLESVLGGLLAANFLMKRFSELPEETICGQLWRHLLTAQKNFQPQNANFGILPPLEAKKAERKKLYYERSLNSIRQFFTD